MCTSQIKAKRIDSVPQKKGGFLSYPGADPGGGPRGPGPPLTLGFEAPKLSIFGPYLIFP